MSTAENIFEMPKDLPKQAQDKLLRRAEGLARDYPSAASSPLTLRDAAELRGKWPPGMETGTLQGMEAFEPVSIFEG